MITGVIAVIIGRFINLVSLIRAELMANIAEIGNRFYHINVNLTSKLKNIQQVSLHFSIFSKSIFLKT